MLRFLFLVICLIGQGTLLLRGASPLETGGWKAGAASVKITPTEPMWMAGYASRTSPSEGTTQDLFAKAIALEDKDGHRLVVVTMDLIGIPTSLRESVQAALLEKHQLPPEALLLNCSHTHCGPDFRVGQSVYLEVMHHESEIASRYGAELANKIVAISGEALQQMAPARVSYSHARCGFAMNRRLPTPTGFKNSPYPDGPVDHSVPVLLAETAEGKPLAVLFGYACHNTTLSFNQFCGDYAGYAQEYLEKAHPGMTALFMAGCGGDQNPYPRGTLELAQTHGRTLAAAVETALITEAKKPLTGQIKPALATIKLPFGTPPAKEELETRLKSKNKWEAIHARLQLDTLAGTGSLESTFNYPVQVVHFGNELAMVALGGEVVIDYALRLKRELQHPAVWVAGYSNDVMGYIPSLRILKEGGYEAGGAMLYTKHPGPWSDQVEELIISKVHEMDRRLSAP